MYRRFITVEYSFRQKVQKRGQFLYVDNAQLLHRCCVGSGVQQQPNEEKKEEEVTPRDYQSRPHSAAVPSRTARNCLPLWLQQCPDMGCDMRPLGTGPPPVPLDSLYERWPPPSLQSIVWSGNSRDGSEPAARNWNVLME